ncbi:MAG TPA: DUF1499 domain-containing protein [Longimicrobiales bacterium]
MSLLLRRLWRGLTRRAAATAPDADDPRLRGRTYAIPFDRVWCAALELASGRLRRWRILEADDREGILQAEARSLLFGTRHEVTISITLDENAQTRVDARAATDARRPDFGSSARKIGAFFRALDRTLGLRATPAPHPAPAPPLTPGSIGSQ